MIAESECWYIGYMFAIQFLNLWRMIHDDSWLMIDNNDDGDDDDDDDGSDGGDDGREITSTSMPRVCQQCSSIELSSCL